MSMKCYDKNWWFCLPDNMAVFENRTHFEITCDVIRSARIDSEEFWHVAMKPEDNPAFPIYTNFLAPVLRVWIIPLRNQYLTQISFYLSASPILKVRGRISEGWCLRLSLRTILHFTCHSRNLILKAAVMTINVPFLTLTWIYDFPSKCFFCSLNLFQWCDRNTWKCNHAFICAGSFAIATLSLI